MVKGTPLGTELIGRTAFEDGGHAAGRVVAVIHRAHGTDVLIRRRRWFQSVVRRVPAVSITVLGNGDVLIPAARLGPVVIQGGAPGGSG